VTEPLVSIVIVNHNYGRYIGEAIESALQQSYPRIEVLVVDDGSTDDSREVIARYPVPLVMQRRAGVCAARNRGARDTSGDLLMFLDADDVLEPLYVERCREALSQLPATVAYAYTQMRLFGDENGIFESGPFSRRRAREGNLVHASALMRREAFDLAGGYDPRFALGHEDHELWVRMLDRGLTGVFVAEPLLRYRRHSGARNILSDLQLEELDWRVRLMYPRLYWRVYLRRPIRALKWRARLKPTLARPLAAGRAPSPTPPGAASDSA